jgi:hypothetical protein
MAMLCLFDVLPEDRELAGGFDLSVLTPVVVRQAIGQDDGAARKICPKGKMTNG